MKCAYQVELLEADGVPYGLVLGWGARAQHEKGIGALLEALTVRKHFSGLGIACSRKAAGRIYVGRALVDGEENCVLALDAYEGARTVSPRAIKRRISGFERLWSDLPDEQGYRAKPLRAAWDDGGFLVHARTHRLAMAVETLGRCFAAEDLAVAYRREPQQDCTGLQADAGAHPCLVLIAPGLCPANALAAMVAAQRDTLGRDATQVQH